MPSLSGQLLQVGFEPNAILLAGPEHWPSLPARKAIALNKYDVNVAGPRRDTFGD